MKFHHILIAVVLLESVALAIDAATSTKPSAESPPGVITLFGPPSSKAEQKLQTMLKEVKFDRVPLEEALNWVRDEVGLNLVVDWRSIEATGIDRKAPVTLRLQDVTAAEALTVICRQAGEPANPLGFAADGNLVYVAERAHTDRHVITRIYDIADLVIQEYARRDAMAAHDDITGWTTEEMIERIVMAMQESIEPETWRENGGSTGMIRELNGRLLITQTPENHRKAAELLDALRTAKVPSPARPTTRPTSRPARPSTGSGLFSD